MKTFAISMFMIFILISCKQNKTFDYFGFSSPGENIELFAPGVVSLKNSKEYSLTISPLGDEVFFAVGSWPETKIMQVRRNGNHWSEPNIAAFFSDYYAVEPAFSPDGKYLYFSSSKGMKDIKQFSIWRVEKVGGKWGNATKVIDNTDPDIWEFHPSITNDGTVYFCSWDSKNNRGSIYKSQCLNGIYSKPVKEDIVFDRQCSVTNPYIDPDRKFIIISTEIKDSKDSYDACISYREGDRWSEPEKFGNRFNTSESDDSFDVSPDGKFLFIYKQDNVYWTETKGVLK